MRWTLLWYGILDGRWSLVDFFDHQGRRHLVARKKHQDGDGLSPRERQVAACASLGHSNKQIAYDLGLRSSTVATHLTSAAQKLGFSSRQTLISCWRVLSAGALEGSVDHFDAGGVEHAVLCLSADPLPAGLTCTERAIAAAVVAGGSNDDIARSRGISARTVANHLASIYRKLGVRSRAELAARVGR